MNRLRAIFAGTPAFAVPSLKALLDFSDVDVCAVYTQPDRPAGRGRKITMSPVKEVAVDAGIALAQPATLGGETAHREFADHRADLLVVAAYGLILPTPILGAVRYPINVHASLLPRWRGAAPIQRAILAGDEMTGISIMRIVEALDAGPVWLHRTCPIESRETGASLHDKLSLLGAEVLRETLTLLMTGSVKEVRQDETGATYAEKIVSADRNVDWHDSAARIDLRVRALSPQPGARFKLGKEYFKIISGHTSPAVDAPPGTLIGANASGLRFATQEGTYTVTNLQPPGKKPMVAEAFVNGYGQLL